MILLSLLLACGAEPKDCPPCEQTAPTPSGSETLSAFEAELLAVDLADLRKGVRPFGADSFGVCAGERECEKFLGVEPGELPPGDYIITAELAVPRLGSGWQVEFAMQCETTDAKGNRSAREDARTYTVSYSGTERGYRLTRLRTIESPDKDGAKRCDFTLTPIRPDKERGSPLKGSFSTPAP